MTGPTAKSAAAALEPALPDAAPSGRDGRRAIAVAAPVQTLRHIGKHELLQDEEDADDDAEDAASDGEDAAEDEDGDSVVVSGAKIWT